MAYPGQSRVRLRPAALLAVFLLFAAPAVALLWMTAVPGRSHSGPLPPLQPQEESLAERLKGHVRTLAAGPRNVGNPAALERSALYIERALAGLGYEVQRQAYLADGLEVRNIEAVINPAAPDAPALVVGAHYDSWFDSPGANDNATGAAAVIELARALRGLSGRSALRIRLVLFVNEEPPYFRTELMGSLVYARRLAASREEVVGMLSLETLGFYSEEPNSQHYPPPLGLLYPETGDFVAFVGMVSSRPFVRRAVKSFRDHAAIPSVGGTAPGWVQGIGWSDHWAFAEVGFPALMVTDTAPFRYPHYHSVADTPDKVDYRRLARVVSALERTIRDWAAVQPK